ncbi:MAG: hypothetical protein D6720_13175 [Gammaproteobacteria bacterium]|nr:MAG: hypothetical protein D6720_13175 [Gammaproteobacteria bacterium]
MPETKTAIEWIDATETPPPFGRYLLVVTGRFADPARRAQTHRMLIARLVQESPNDEAARSEYKSWLAGEDDFGAYQFYLQPAEKAWMGKIDVGLQGDSDFCDLYSDAISHWAECPAMPPLAGKEVAA